MKKRRFFIICICFIFHMKTGYFNKRFISCFSIMKSRILLLIIKVFFIIMYVFLHAIFLFKQNMSLFFYASIFAMQDRKRMLLQYMPLYSSKKRTIICT